MSLEDLTDDVESEHANLGDEIAFGTDRQTRNELALLRAALGTDTDELVRRGVHLLFQTTVDTASLDANLRQAYDVTYDEYLSGMTYDEMAGEPPSRDDERRYQF